MPVLITCTTNNALTAATKGIEAICTKCGCQIWFSDSSMQGAKERHPDIDFEIDPPTLICINCDDREFDIDKVSVPTDTEYNEIIAVLKKKYPGQPMPSKEKFMQIAKDNWKLYKAFIRNGKKIKVL